MRIKLFGGKTCRKGPPTKEISPAVLPFFYINGHANFNHPGNPEGIQSVFSVTPVTLAHCSFNEKSTYTKMAVPRVDSRERRPESRRYRPLSHFSCLSCLVDPGGF